MPSPTLITRNEAYARGLAKFYTGRPCKNKHVGERYVINGACVDCTYRKRAPGPSLSSENVKLLGAMAFPGRGPLPTHADVIVITAMFQNALHGAFERVQKWAEKGYTHEQMLWLVSQTDDPVFVFSGDKRIKMLLDRSVEARPNITFAEPDAYVPRPPAPTVTVESRPTSRMVGGIQVPIVYDEEGNELWLPDPTS